MNTHVDEHIFREDMQSKPEWKVERKEGFPGSHRHTELFHLSPQTRREVMRSQVLLSSLLSWSPHCKEGPKEDKGPVVWLSTEFWVPSWAIFSHAWDLPWILTKNVQAIIKREATENPVPRCPMNKKAIWMPPPNYERLLCLTWIQHGFRRLFALESIWWQLYQL